MGMGKRGKGERGLFGQALSVGGDAEIVKIARLAARLGRRHLSTHAHPFAPKKFTQPQLFACLIVKAHLGCTYRRVEELLMLMPRVREAIGLREVPRSTPPLMAGCRPSPIVPRSWL